MVTQSTLALRFPKQHPRFYNVKAVGWNNETIDTRLHIKIDPGEALYIAPRRFSEVSKVIFWCAILNEDPVLTVDCRMRCWAAGAADLPTSPDLVLIQEGTRTNAGVDYTIASIGNRRFSHAGDRTTFPDLGSGGNAIVTQEFDVFNAADQDFFQAWNLASDVDQYMQMLFALEIFVGDNSDFRCTNWGYVVVQAPSPANHTASYVPIWPGQQIPASGPNELDRSEAPAHDQVRGAWSWTYHADEWDGISGIHLLMYYGTGSNNADMEIEVQKVNSRVQAGASTTTIITDTIDVTQAEHGIYRSVDILPFLSDGDEICADWFQSPVGAVAFAGITGQAAFLLEITQRDCTKTVSYFAAGVSVTRAHGGMQGGDPLPQIFASGTLIDPTWFQRYPDSLFTKRLAHGTIVHDNASVDPQYQICMNSDLTEPQNGPPGSGLTATTTIIHSFSATPTNEFPEWKEQEADLTIDPINFAGRRKLFLRAADSWIAGNNDHPGLIYLKYAYAVPNTEFLDLGPLFPVGEFNPEGCASTSAGLGDPGVLVITNGSTIPKKFDPVAGKIEDAGIPLPFEGEFPQGSALTVNNFAVSPNGGIVPGRYEYRYTFRNCCTGKESDPNPDTFVIDSAAAGASPAAKHNISFVGIRIPGDPQICEICIYRTALGGEFPIMAKVGCIDIDQTTLFVDTVPDALLDFVADGLALLNAPMPCVPVVVEYQNRLFGLGDIPQLAPAGLVSVVAGSKIVEGDEDVEWERCLEGKFIQVQGDCRPYEIERILPPVAGNSPAIGRLKLVEEYEGSTDTSLTYTICGHQNRLFFSEPLEAECWPNINFLDIEPGDGDKLIGGASNFGSLVICKRRKTYILRFNVNPLLEVNVPPRISTDIGCIGPRSFAQVENGTVWLSDRGLAMFDGRGVRHIPASDRFNDMLINPDNPNYVRRDAQGRVIDAVGVFYPKREQYLLLLPTVNTTRGSNMMLVWDTSLDNITLYEFCQEFQAMVVAKDSDGNQRVYLGDVNGFVWIFDVGHNDGVGFPNATGTVRGTVSSAGLQNGASFLEDTTASFVTGGLPQLAMLSGVQGLTPALSTLSPDATGDLGSAGVCLFTRAKGAALDAPWTERTVYATTDTRIYVTPGWGADQPNPEDDYMLGAIEFSAVFKPKNYGTDDQLKRDWKQVLTYVPEGISSKVRVELRPDFATSDDEELTVIGPDGETGEGRVFDLSFPQGRLQQKVGKRVHNFMQTRLSNFAPEEPIRILNHNLMSNPRSQ